MDKKTIVLTLYGTEKTIKDFIVTLFDEDYTFNQKSSVQRYCSNINDIELKDDNWIYATMIIRHLDITGEITVQKFSQDEKN
jgi:hypothetical protein